MTVKAIALLRAKPGIGREAFVRYYEANHAPLMTGLLDGIVDYRRNYVDLGTMVAGPNGAAPDYDSVTELWFEDRAAFDRAMRIMEDPDKGPKVAADEENFLDRAATRMFLVEEHGPATTPSAADKIAFMTAYYEAYNSADPAKLAPFYADDVVLTSANGVIEGKQALLGVYQHILGGFDDRMTPSRIVGGADAAMVEIDDVLTAKVDVPDFLGKPCKAGEAITLRLAGAYAFDGDRLKRITLYSL